MLAKARRLLPSRIRIDPNVGWILVGRGWNIAAGLATIIAMSAFLSPTLQGYYFTFASLIALQALFELGLTQIIVQTTSHEFAFLSPAARQQGLEATIHGRKLLFIGAFAHHWYRGAALVYAGVLSTLGTAYFYHSATLPMSQWMPQWLLLTAFSALNLFLTPRLAFVEGAGHPGAVAHLKLRQSVLGYLAMLGMLAGGLDLWSVAIVPATNVVMTAMWLRRTTLVPNFFRVSRPASPDPQDIAWRGEIFALQWRVALCWLGGYLSSFAFTPLVFSRQGAEMAGQWGLTFSALVAIQTLGMSWVNAHGPNLGALIARGERERLNRLFRTAAIRSTLLTAAGCAGFVAIIWIANRLGVEIVHRLLGYRATIWLGIAIVGNAAIYSLAIYMRAHKEEPLVLSSIVIGGVTALAAFVGARHGAEALAFIYMAITLAINLPWSWILYRRYARRAA